MAIAGPAAQARLLEGVAAVLASQAGSSRRGVLVDDVHAADEATLDVLAYLGRRLRGQAAAAAPRVAQRGVPPGHRLRRLATELPAPERRPSSRSGA